MSDDTQPDESIDALATVKAEFPLKRVKRVVFTHDGDKVPFIMTAPNRAEWKKFRSDLDAAKGNADKSETAIENAALAMIRWPDRETVRAIFNDRPALIGHFAEQLMELAGVNAEVNAKNE